MDSDLLVLPHILFSAIVLIGPNFSGKLNTVYPLDAHSGSRPHLRLNRQLIPLANIALYFSPRHRFMIRFILISLSIACTGVVCSFTRDYKTTYLKCKYSLC